MREDDIINSAQNININLELCISYFICVIQSATKHGSEFYCHIYNIYNVRLYIFIHLFL